MERMGHFRALLYGALDSRNLLLCFDVIRPSLVFISMMFFRRLTT